MQTNKEKVKEMQSKLTKLQEAIKFKKQMAAQQTALNFMQGKQQLTNVQYEIEKKKNMLAREQNNLNANIIRENVGNQKYVMDQILSIENQKANQTSNNIAKQEELKNKLDTDMEENTKETKKGLLIAGGGAALLTALKGVGGFIGSVASTLAPVFVPLLAILAVIFAIKLASKIANTEQKKQEIDAAFERTNMNLNDPNYIQGFVKPYMNQLGDVNKNQQEVFQDMVGNLMKDTGLSEENQKQGHEVANDFAKQYGIENNEFLNLPPEQLEKMVNDISNQIDTISNNEEKQQEVEKNNEVSKENNKKTGPSFAELVIKPAAQTIDKGVKKSNTLQISDVNQAKGSTQPTTSGTKQKDNNSVAMAGSAG